jgi:hypothetical protein
VREVTPKEVVGKVSIQKRTVEMMGELCSWRKMREFVKLKEEQLVEPAMTGHTGERLAQTVK